jgi:hypothetical protein
MLDSYAHFACYATHNGVRGSIASDLQELCGGLVAPLQKTLLLLSLEEMNSVLLPLSINLCVDIIPPPLPRLYQASVLFTTLTRCDILTTMGKTGLCVLRGCSHSSGLPA